MFSIFEIGNRNQYVSIKHRVCICTPLIYLYPSHLSYSINWYAASICPYTMKIRVRLIVEIYYPFNVRLICKKVFQRLKKKHNKVSVVGTSFIMVEIACNWLKLKKERYIRTWRTRIIVSYGTKESKTKSIHQSSSQSHIYCLVPVCCLNADLISCVVNWYQ